MNLRSSWLGIATLVACGVARPIPLPSVEPGDLMPRVEDDTSMEWVYGFPPVDTPASWWRRIETGHFALVLDTEKLEIPHFGALPPNREKPQLKEPDVPAWRQLPPAGLELTILANGQTYRCTAGGQWSQFGGPRLIESGRFFQRADVTDLFFATDEGRPLAVKARFETAAWPDRLALIFAARPKEGEIWRDAAMTIRFTSGAQTLQQRQAFSFGEPQEFSEWRQVALAFDPVTLAEVEGSSALRVAATELSTGDPRSVDYDAVLGWFRVNLDGIEPTPPPGVASPSNDAVERVQLVLQNPSGQEQIARLMFEKSGRGIRQRMGSSITGISAMLRDSQGNPTGIPVQLSKNWHTRPEGGVYAGQWFHGISQVRLPPEARVELELILSYGHWGGVPAASHAQLSLIGWGSNQHWSQAAVGAWGESLCFEPDQVQAHCTITDVRPLMVGSPGTGRKWAWTSNVGGGDFFRFFDTSGDRVPHAGMRTIYHRQGPCLTEVTFAGRLGSGARHSSTVSLARTDDLIRAVYRLRLKVHQPMDFSRFVVFQIGADTYSYTGERMLALGNENGLLQEWASQWGGNKYRMEPRECVGHVPWVSLHEAVPRENEKNGAWANRGIVIRAWKARLGGRPASPWMAERGLTLHRQDTSTLDFLPPPGIDRLEPGDFIDATFEHIVVPQRASEYYGPNEALRAALSRDGNTWKMILREAVGNRRRVEVTQGRVEHVFPDIRVRAENDVAKFVLQGGLGYVPITISHLTAPTGYTLTVDGVPVDQSVHGNDFWQTDYHTVTQRWSRTYNIPNPDERPLRRVTFTKTPSHTPTPP